MALGQGCPFLLLNITQLTNFMRIYYVIMSDTYNISTSHAVMLRYVYVIYYLKNVIVFENTVSFYISLI
jgi:hypothetical protein